MRSTYNRIHFPKTIERCFGNKYKRYNRYVWIFNNNSTCLVYSLRFARFIRTDCMRRIRWSCEGLTSVHNDYTGWSLKHLLSRHMYNLPLPIYVLLYPLLMRNSCWLLVSGSLVGEYPSECPVLYCTVSYIAACVDASRTVFWDRPAFWSIRQYQHCTTFSVFSRVLHKVTPMHSIYRKYLPSTT